MSHPIEHQTIASSHEISQVTHPISMHLHQKELGDPSSLNKSLLHLQREEEGRPSYSTQYHCTVYHSTVGRPKEDVHIPRLNLETRRLDTPLSYSSFFILTTHHTQKETLRLIGPHVCVYRWFMTRWGTRSRPPTAISR